VREVLRQVDPELRVELHCDDGARVRAGQRVATLSGSAASLLKAERVALNFAQRMSGVATLTRAYVDALPADTKARLTDTRKTTPGLRALERHAVRAGGGHNHRDDLSAGVLIKDNHIAACGGIRAAIERARAHAPHTLRIECEVDDLAGLDEAIVAGADIVLLDNFTPAQLRQAVKRARGRVMLEASGGVTLERIAAIAASGVDAISVGALTHSAPAVDIALDWARSARRTVTRKRAARGARR
jgi:nicotinate-nucleotide pyrophosphorylase (carboxylating)